LVSPADEVSEPEPSVVPDPGVVVVRVVGTEAEFSVTVAVPPAVPEDVVTRVTETGEAPATPE